MKFQNNFVEKVNWVKMMLKNSSGDPKMCFVGIPNYSKNDYVTVLNCSLIREGSL
jgi:hypothetical protein